MYELIYAPKFKKQLRKLPREIQIRIIKALERCRIRPHIYLIKQIGTTDYKFKVGDYRIFVEVKENKLQVHVLKIDHRSRVYKRN